MSGGGNVFKQATNFGSDLLKNPGKAIGGGFGAVAGNVAGLPGMVAGGLAGSKVGGQLLGGNKVGVPGSQGRPDWVLSSPDGKLRSDLLLNGSMPQAAGQSQSVLNKLQSMGSMVGPSEQAKYLQTANTEATARNIGNIDAMSKSGQAAAMSNLAMRGGADAGARGRMARASFADVLGQKNQAMGDASLRELDILAKDEANKQQIMQALPAQLLAQAGFEQAGKQFDISNTLGTVGGKYKEDMAAWAANQSAREQAQAANKNKGLLGLGVLGL